MEHGACCNIYQSQTTFLKAYLSLPTLTPQHGHVILQALTVLHGIPNYRVRLQSIEIRITEDCCWVKIVG